MGENTHGRSKLVAPRVQYARAADGSNIAYVTSGEGYPFFWLPHFLASHVQMEWEFPQRFVYTRLAQRLQVIRFDCRGLGLSDREVSDISLEARISDLDAVADKLGLKTFALAGIEGGGNLAAAYAQARPERVSRLVLINWTPRFRADNNSPRLKSLGRLMRDDWELFTENIGSQSFGYDTPLARGYSKLVRGTVSHDLAVKYGDQLSDEEMLPILAGVKTETLVLHSQKNAYATEDAARLTAATTPRASLVTFEGGLPDHIYPLLDAVAEFVVQGTDAPATAQTPAWPESAPVADDDAGLTARELEILSLLARGFSNREMADQLVLSPRTIERHLENLYRKTGARNRAEATAYAYTRGLVSRD
jgi:pimeloyl-ACP methyl ester carboxylesterase/DNA-binding CsgD family transcriptional regulator